MAKKFFSRTRRLRPRQKELIAVFVGVLLLLYVAFQYEWRMLKIKKEPKITVGYVYKILRRGAKQGGVSLCYRYTVSGVDYEDCNGYRLLNSRDGREAFDGRTFPVIYERGDPGSSKLLINKNDFDVFSISFPDSLLWVKKYFPSPFE